MSLLGYSGGFLADDLQVHLTVTLLQVALGHCMNLFGNSMGHLAFQLFSDGFSVLQNHIAFDQVL